MSNSSIDHHHEAEVQGVFSQLTPQALTVLSLLIAMVAIILVITFTGKKKSKGDSLLLLGPPDGGKTAILSMLVYNQALPTHTSIQTNSSLVHLPDLKHPLRVIDVPGHPRVRDQFKEQLREAKVVAFVVDASTISRNGAAAAEHLHVIMHSLTSLPPSQTPPSLVILAHKADLLKTTSASSNTDLAIHRVRAVLERELEIRRVSQADGVGVESLGAEDEGTELGGLECVGGDGTFKFADWDGGEIVFFGTSIQQGSEKDAEKSGGNGLASFRLWLEDNM